jgi:serine/threonine-protein kinase
LNHPNIVQVYTLGRDGDRRFIAMEYVQGATLKDYLVKKGTVDVALALSILRQASQAIAAAGELGLIHRDIKPENLLLTRKGQVKVADFGLCREQGSETLNLTQEGVTLGTPLYMSPEQVQGKALDHRSDLYSLGVTAYQMLSGVTPFRAETAMAVALKHLQEAPVSLAVRRPDLPPDLVALVMRLLKKKPEERYQSARELLRELTRIRDDLTKATGLPATAETQALRRASEAAGYSGGEGKTTVPARPWRERMPAIRIGARTLVLLGLLGLLAGAGWGYSRRMPDLLGSKAPLPSGAPGLWIAPEWREVAKQATAAEQYRLAQLDWRSGRREAGWLAVPGYFPGDRQWGTQAYIQCIRQGVRRSDVRLLASLAESFEGVPSPTELDGQLAALCRLGVAILSGKPEEIPEWMGKLNLDFADPALAEVALEMALKGLENRPSNMREASPLINLRDMLGRSLRLESNLESASTPSPR